MNTASNESLIVLDTISEGLVRFDPSHRFAFINSAAEDLIGVPRARLLGTLPAELEVAGDALDEICRRVTELLRPVTVESFLPSVQRWYAITGTPDANGGVVIHFSDLTAHREMEDRLRKSEEKFTKGFGFSPMPKCIVDVDAGARILDVNEAFERLTGYSRGEAVGRTPVDLNFCPDTSRPHEALRPLLAKGGSRDQEVRIRRKDGEIRIWLVSAAQIEIDRRLCSIWAAQDITDARQTELALRESEEFFRRLFEVECDALVVVEYESGRLIEANAAAGALYGYSRDELVGMNRVDLSAEPEKTIASTMGMQTFIPLRWHRRKDGTVFPVEISGTYFELHGRKVFISAIRDITQRRLMEQALQKSQEKFSKAFQANPAAIVLSDLAARHVIEVNDTFEKITGYARGEVIGDGWSDGSFWEDTEEHRRVIASLAGAGKVRNWEFGFRRKSGTVGRGLLSAELIEIEGKLYAITTFIDITERSRLERQVRQSQKLETVGRLAGGIAHDFNNLLTVILGYSDFILSSTAPTEPVHAGAAAIRDAGEHAAGLTRQLLAFSRKQVIEPRQLDLNTVVTGSDRILRRLIGEDVEITTRLDPQLPAVLADPDQIRQILLNLAVNARDAMPQGGTLDIATSTAAFDEWTVTDHPDARPGEYCVLCVSDTGVGMDDNTLQSAFEPFFTTKEPDRGTGLGLPTVYGIVRQNHGWIDVRSKVGHGSSFSIYLPRMRQPSDPEPSAPPDEPPDRGTGESILLVEDDADVRRLTRVFLESGGYRVIESASSAEALASEAVQSGWIHLLVTDVVLPGGNGKALAEQLRLLHPNLKVLFMSGYTADIVSSRGVLEADTGYLAKPFTRESLLAKVREVLATPSAERHA